MKKDAVTFAQLTARLYGWITKYGKCTRLQFADRKRKDGEPYLTLGEAIHFSRYAGYDLTKD